MRKKNFLNKVLQNTSCPQGFWGRMILRGMNCFHASLANRGMKQVEWQPEWNVLDIGCGGGANLKRLLNWCEFETSIEFMPKGKHLRHRPVRRKCLIRPKVQYKRLG